MKQTYTDWEFLVVDDASVDGTCEYLRELAVSNTKVKHLRFEENVGLPAITLAHAFLKAKGELIAFNFDDTVLRPNCIAKLVEKLTNEPELDMAYGQMLMHMPDGKVVDGEPVSLERLREVNFIGNASVMLRRRLISKIGWYDPNVVLKRCCDWDLWLRAFESASVGYIPEILSEELGQSLTDSFRRSCFIFPELVRKYMATSRNAGLRPELIAAGDWDITKAPCVLTPSEEQMRLYCALENAIRTLDSEEIIEFSENLLQSGSEDCQLLWARLNRAQREKRSNNESLLLFGLVHYYNNQLNTLRENLQQHESTIHTTQSELGELKDDYHRNLRSLSWRLTKPLRTVKSLWNPNRKE